LSEGKLDRELVGLGPPPVQCYKASPMQEILTEGKNEWGQARFRPL